MSSRKKKGGIKRTNKSQQQSTGAPTSGSKGIARRNVTGTCKEEKVAKGISRRGVTTTSQVEKKNKSKGGVRDAGAQSKEKPSDKKVIKRRDKNKKAEVVREKIVARANTMHTRSGVEEVKKSVARTGKMNQTSSSLGLETKSSSAKKGTIDPNKSYGKEEKRIGIRGAGGAQARSAPSKPKSAAKKKAASAGAFTTSTREAPVGGGGIARRAKTGTSRPVSKPAPTKKRTGTGRNAHQGSNNIFGASGASSSAAPRSTPAHMKSGFTFG